MKDLKKEKANISKAGLITLIVFVVVLAIMMTVFCVLYAINKNSYEESAISLENIYQRSFFDLVDNVNNAEVKLGKLVNSTGGMYSKKLLTEIHENANDAQNNLSYLPISMNGIPETTKFINQLSGFTSVLASDQSDTLSSENLKTLKQLYNSVSSIKYKLNEMSTEIMDGYNISKHSNLKENASFTDFTSKIQGVKTVDEDYPSMIYDGPFSDSVVNKEIKGLNFKEISKEEATEIAKKLFEKQEEASKDVEGSTPPENQATQFVGETNGKFKTYDFKIVLEGGQEYYAQITKAGGKLLTLSSHANRADKTLSNQEAIEIATGFAKAQGLSNMECVWSDVVGNDTYLNLAPVEDNIILYPDLIKVKVDLATGNILGWEATSYYTNHVERNLPSPSYSKAEAKAKISNDFKIVSSRLALSPLEYNREVLTYEFECEKAGATYYFYFNAENGNLENILKVIKTDNGNLLM